MGLISSLIKAEDKIEKRSEPEQYEDFNKRSRDTKTSLIKNGAITLTVHDTDFLMKLFLRASIQGNEIDQAHNVFSKLKTLHKGNLEDES